MFYVFDTSVSRVVRYLIIINYQLCYSITLIKIDIFHRTVAPHAHVKVEERMQKRGMILIV